MGKGRCGCCGCLFALSLLAVIILILLLFSVDPKIERQAPATADIAMQGIVLRKVAPAVLSKNLTPDSISTIELSDPEINAVIRSLIFFLPFSNASRENIPPNIYGKYRINCHNGIFHVEMDIDTTVEWLGGGHLVLTFDVQPEVTPESVKWNLRDGKIGSIPIPSEAIEELIMKYGPSLESDQRLLLLRRMINSMKLTPEKSYLIEYRPYYIRDRIGLSNPF